MIFAPHPLPSWGCFRVAGICIDLMNQNVATIALLDDALSRTGITGNDNRPISSLEAIAKRARPPLAMPDGCQTQLYLQFDQRYLQLRPNSL